VSAPDDGVEIAGLAVLYQRLSADHRQLLENSARWLTDVVPAAVRVQRRGLFNRGPARAVEVQLGEETFELREDRGQVTAHIGHTVSGVVLARQPVSADEWVSRLRDALARAAATSEAVRVALSRLT